VWNEALASMAQSWAAGCDWSHGQPKLDTDQPFDVIGQNLYMVTGRKAVNLTDAVQLWFDEKMYYNYDKLECAAHKMCGHYTQVSAYSWRCKIS